MAQNVQQEFNKLILCTATPAAPTMNPIPILNPNAYPKQSLNPKLYAQEKYKCRLEDTIFEKLYQNRETTGDIKFVVHCKYPRNFFFNYLDLV